MLLAVLYFIKEEILTSLKYWLNFELFLAANSTRIYFIPYFGFKFSFLDVETRGRV